jgi:putative hydrolase of HD superfamily
MLNCLIELQRLKQLDRTGWSLRGLPSGTESVAAHSFGVCIAAMLLSDHLISHDVPVDINRVLRMALLHDWSEARIGDLPKTAMRYFGAAERKRAETESFSDIVRGLENHATYVELFEEYESRLTLEACLVKAADIIDLLVEVLALERAGARGLDEFWEVASNPNLKLEGPARELIEEILNSLLKERRELHLI